MIPGNTPGDITQEQAESVVARLKSFKKRNSASQGDVASAIGVGSSTLSQVLAFKYPGDWQKVIRDLDRWLEDQEKREAAPKPVNFVWTEVAREIEAIARAAYELQGIGLVYGPAGIGKTLALRAIREDIPGSVLLTCESVSPTAAAVMQELGLHLRINRLTQYHSLRHWADAIKSTLKGSGRLIIIDQIHKLCGIDPNDRALYALCDLHDATEVPMLWCGTTDLVAYLSRGEKRGKQPLAQIRSRICIARDLEARLRAATGPKGGGGRGQRLFTVEEIRKVFAQNKLRLTSDGAAFLARIANVSGSGGLRECAYLVRLATMMFARSQDALDVDCLLKAQEMRVNASMSSQYDKEVEEDAVIAAAG